MQLLKEDLIFKVCL